MTYQPNADNAHDHPYPMASEEQSYFDDVPFPDVMPFPDRINRQMAALRSEVEALRTSLAQTDAIVHRYINRNEGDAA